MRTSVTVLALALATVPSSLFAQPTMSNVAMKPTIATIVCRPVATQDTTAMMSQNHETSPTQADGSRLVCVTLIAMHDAMVRQHAAASQAKDPATASAMWADFTQRYLDVPF